MKKLLLVALFCVGCASDPDIYYSLRPDLDPEPLQQQTPTAIRYTELPPYYDREFFAYYGAHGQIIIDKKHHWVFPFVDNFRDTLRQALAKATGNGRIYTYPLGDNIRPVVLIDIQVRDLIANSIDHTFLLAAQWQNTTRDEHEPQNHRVALVLPLPDASPAGIAAATKEAVNELAKAIAATLKNR